MRRYALPFMGFNSPNAWSLAAHVLHSDRYLYGKVRIELPATRRDRSRAVGDDVYSMPSR